MLDDLSGLGDGGTITDRNGVTEDDRSIEEDVLGGVSEVEDSDNVDDEELDADGGD